MSSRGRLPRAHASRRTWWLVAAVVVLGTLAYAAWSVVTTRSDLMDARVHADRVQLALQQDDVGDARLFLAQLQEDLSGAHGRTDGPLWALAARLPLVGDDVHAVRTSAAVGDQLAHGPLHELVDGAGSELRERLVPRNGRVDLAAVEEFAPLVSRLRRNLNESAGQLAAVPTGGLTRWTRPAFTALDDRVQAADAAASAADRAVRVLPTMLGQDKPQKYLLLFGNNAEVRATGGLPGAWALVETDAGRISLTRQGAGADFGELDEPVLPLSAAEEAIYDQQLGTFFLDTNFTPEFPRTAELVRAMWRQRFDQRLDGVLSVDAVSMSYLLRSTGLVTAPGGIPLTPENATSELLNRVYFRLEDPEAQNAFFTEVARRVFKKVTTGVRSVPALFEALNQGVAEGRLYVHDFDPLVQRVLAGSPVAGEIRGSDPRVPEVGVYLNDATGSKMSYYLRTRACAPCRGVCLGGAAAGGARRPDLHRGQPSGQRAAGVRLRRCRLRHPPRRAARPDQDLRATRRGAQRAAGGRSAHRRRRGRRPRPAGRHGRGAAAPRRDRAGQLAGALGPLPGPAGPPDGDPGHAGGTGRAARARPVLGLTQLPLLIIPAPTVTPVASSIRMNEPVVRFLE